jgi:hypothetical protein
MDPHFRPLAEEDRAFLLAKEEDQTPYTIPPLGRHYTDVWSEDDLPGMSRSPTSSETSSRQGSHDHLKYLGSSDRLTDDHLFKDDISCGHLTERLLSSLVADSTQIDIAQEEEDEFMASDLVLPTKSYNRSIEEISSVLPDDIAQFEERLKRELRYAGLFGEDDVKSYH